MSENLFDDPRVAELVGGGLAAAVSSVLASVEIAEDEIAQARGTDTVDRDDPLWRAFRLLRVTHDLMRTEFVYRSHCRELLDRVRRGADTRPATDAEIVAVISEGSQRVPLASEVVALQMRLFKRAFPEKFALLDFDIDLYERMHGREADDWERRLRRRLRQDWRHPDAKED